MSSRIINRVAGGETVKRELLYPVVTEMTANGVTYTRLIRPGEKNSHRVYSSYPGAFSAVGKWSWGSKKRAKP